VSPSSDGIRSANPDRMSSTNPFTSDSSEEELEGPRPGPVSKLFGLSRHEREAREGRVRKGSEEKLMPLVAASKGKVKVGSRGKICFSTTSVDPVSANHHPYKVDPVLANHHPYNPFSSSEEEEEEGCSEDRRGRVRGRSVAGQERRRAQLVTTLTLLLVAFVMVTAIISGLATRHSSVETPPNANETGGQDLVETQTVELTEAVKELPDEKWPHEEELHGLRVTGGEVEVVEGEHFDKILNIESEQEI